MLELPQLEGHEAQFVPGMRARKAYVCPNCGNTVPAGTGHVVVWPEHDVDARRHWHRHCWHAAVRRGRIA